MVEGQVESQQLQDQIMADVAWANAIKTCRRIIQALLFQPPPTLDLMIKACTKRAAILEPQQRGFEETPTAAPAIRPPGPLQCWICGEEGHIARGCPRRQPLGNFQMNLQGERGNSLTKTKGGLRNLTASHDDKNEADHHRDPEGLWKAHAPFTLCTTKPINFETRHWQVVSLDPWDLDLLARLDCKYIVIRDTKYMPPETEVAPAMITLGLEGFTLMAHYIHPPYFIAKGHIIAQAIPLPDKRPVDDAAPCVYWAELMGQKKTMMGCGLYQGEDYHHLNRLLGMGEDVTIIPSSKWLSHWELQPVASSI
ncbi:uncharacterized protein LOC107216366 [Parus major]|uniref:uncharacterized protein LOC107216366 n=1 Tax=Parus major TaxID=9157 RepID=UPI001443913F|nr:uncharacterized protein LOC107216366 [Parus major]